MKNSNYLGKTRALVEGAMMISLATVLGIFKLVDMPYGGSVTIASMLPMIIFAYRHGVLVGIGAGAVYAVLEQLLGLSTLSYVTGWQSVVAVILLDYIVAFAVVGLGGVFRGKLGSQKSSLIYGALLVMALRYVCHVISGATVWAGLSIPSSAALIYSISYNATYMIPETVILIAVAYYLGEAIDFSKDTPTRMTVSARGEKRSILSFLGGLSFLIGFIVDVWLISPHLQDANTGEFSFAGLSQAPWIAISIVTPIAIILGLTLLFAKKRK